MPIVAGGGVGLVLALFPCLYCVRCVAGSRATQLDAGGMGAGVVFPPCVCCSLSSSSFVSCVVGEDTALIGGGLRLSINNYLTKHWDRFNIWARRFVETKPQTNENN